MHNRNRCAAGFTLIEMTVVLLIVSILIGSMLVSLGVQIETQQNREATATLDQVKNALMRYARTYGYLPCPDNDLDGFSDPRIPREYFATPPILPTLDVCDVFEGTVPWETLGVPQTDTWNNLLRYSVTRVFASTSITLASVGDIEIRNRGDDPATTGTTEVNSAVTLTNSAAAIVMSTGRNERGGIDPDGNAGPATEPMDVVFLTTVSDEQENEDVEVPPIYFSRLHTSDADNCSDDMPFAPIPPLCEFDDLLVWIPDKVLLSKLVESGKLP